MASEKRTLLENVARWMKTISPRKYAITTVTSNGVEVTRLVDYNTYCEEGYKRNAVVYSAVREIARTAPSARLQVHKRLERGQTEIQESHPIQGLLDFPNPSQSHYDFLEMMITYLNLDGNAYILRERQQTATVAMWLPRPDMVSAVVDVRKSLFEKGALLGYAYTTQNGEKLYFLPEDVIHIKYPNPNDPHGGLGRGHPPLMAAAADVDNDNNQTSFIRQFFKNGAVPSGIIKSKNVLDDAEVRRIQSRIGEQYAGEQNWHKVMVLDADAEFQQTGLNMDEMVFPDLRAISETRVCAAFKVPPVLIGVKAGLDAATYSNYALARRALWEDNIIPTTTKLAEALTRALSDEMDDDIIILADYSNVVALQDDRANRFARANQAVAGGWITVNEARREVGLGPLPIGVGDVLYRPLMSESVDDGAGDASKSEKAVESSKLKAEREIVSVFEKTEHRRQKTGSSSWPTTHVVGTALMRPVPLRSASGIDNAAQLAPTGGIEWKLFDRVARRWEGQFKRTAARLFEEEVIELAARVNGSKGKSIKTIEYDAILQAILIYLVVDAVKKWQAGFLPLMLGLTQAQVETWTGGIGIDWDIDNPAVADFIKQHAYTFAQRISDTTVEEIRRLLLMAHDEGWSVVRMMDEIKTVYGGWSDLRAEMIARSETIRSSNAGLVEGYRLNGITQIEWFAALDDRLCPFCGEMHGKQMAIGEAWYTDGSEMFVGQERLVMNYGDVFYPPLHPNCRCVVQPVVGDS